MVWELFPKRVLEMEFISLFIIQRLLPLQGLVKSMKSDESLKLNMQAFKKNKSGFTYIEMLVVISLLALCFVPLLQMFAQSMDEVSQYSDLGTAIQLGRESMEAIKNLRYTEDQIESQGTVWSPPENEPPMDINGKQWRVKRTIVENTNPLEVHVEVFRSQDPTHAIIELVTLLEDL